MKFEQLMENVLSESRSNPLLNPKITATDVLSRYGNTKNVFVHFSDIEKIGINPTPDPRYPNPYGVYSYPMSEIKKATNGFSVSIYDRIFAGHMKYIFVFDYASNRTLDLSSTAIRQEDFQRTVEYFITRRGHKTISEITDHLSGKINTGIDLWMLVFELIDFLDLPTSKTSHTVFRKVLGYDLIIDPGTGTMYGKTQSNIRTQAVHLDSSKIRVIDVLDNKKDEPQDRIEGRRELDQFQKRHDNIRKIETDSLLKQDSLQIAAKKVQHGNFLGFMDEFSNIMNEMKNGGDPVRLSKFFFGRLIALTEEISKNQIMPTEEETDHIQSAILAIHYSTGIDGDFMSKLSTIDLDFAFDVNEISNDYYDVATSALGALERL